MQETTIPGEVTDIMNPDADKNSKESSIQALMTMQFDSYKDNKDKYKVLIQEIRKKLKCSDWFGIPYLAPQQRPETPKNTEWLDIKLVAMEYEITVRVQQTNLYIRGYKRTSSTDTFFWQFNDEKLIAGAKELNFSGKYAGGLDKKGTTRETLKLGKNQLQEAIHGLAKLARPDKDHKTAEEFLLVLIQMIPEAARFIPISDYIYQNYDTGKPVEGRMIAMENAWDKLSTSVFQDNSPTATTKLPNIDDDTPTKIVTFGDACRDIGMLLDVRKTGLMVMDGRCLMNLEYVRVHGSKLSGTVIVHDGRYAYTFYEGSEDVGPGGFATLTDPARSHPVSGVDAFIISVDLFDQKGGIAQGEIVWDERVALGNHDKHLQQVVKGEYGDVTVGYSVLSNALGVIIQVLLENGDGEVYGTVRASQALGGLTPITLFLNSPEERVKLSKGDPIPLTRKAIAASMSTVLTITADVLGAVIAQGSVDFTVKQGTYTEKIDGQYGSLKVIITCE